MHKNKIINVSIYIWRTYPAVSAHCANYILALVSGPVHYICVISMPLESMGLETFSARNLSYTLQSLFYQ